MTTTCPNCGKEIADDGFHPCKTGEFWIGNDGSGACGVTPPTVVFEMRDAPTLIFPATGLWSSGPVPVHILGITISPDGNVGIGY